MDLTELKQKLEGEQFAALESHVNELISQRDEARREAIERRKAIKSNADASTATIAKLMEKLGIETLDELDALPAARGQAEALKQLETRLKAKDSLLTERDKAIADLMSKHRDALLANELERVMATHEFVDREVVAAFIRQHLDFVDDKPVFQSEGQALPVTEGVAKLLEAKPTLLKSAGARGSGYNPNARGGGVKPFGEMTLTERSELYRRNPTEYDRLEAAHSET